MSELIKLLDSMSSSDPRFVEGVGKLIDNMDNLSPEDRNETFLLMEKLVKGDEQIAMERSLETEGKGSK